ncbi:MAG: hypothetical protein O9337_21635 [Acidovorax sp.]|uniref:hypothetical protein n=1 Tax=Acidovorax TaxID=12916 RepID=UPI0022C8F70C|nr:hypothetical protein [Acidovorax sp.]MCZ8222032.1 hypothetical protein [Acidovorax sp.]
MMRRHSDILAILQSVAGIVKCRHALPILANVFSRRTASIGFMDLEIGPLVLEAPARHIGEVFALFARPVAKLKQAFLLNSARTSYFSSKVNGYNAL